MRRRSWTERQLEGVSSDGGGVVLMVVMMMLIVKKRIMMMVVVVKLLTMVKLMFFSSEKLPKNCLLRSSRSFERSSPFSTGAKKY